MKQRIIEIFVLMLLILSACGGGASSAPQSIPLADLSQITEVKIVQLLEAPAGLRLYNPNAIGIILSARAGEGVTIPDFVLQKYLTEGIPVESIMQINEAQYFLVQGSKTGFEPKSTGGFVVGYCQTSDCFIKMANGLADRQSALMTGRNGVNAMLDGIWAKYGDQLPDGFPRQASNPFWAQFPSGEKYLAYETGNFGTTIEQEVLQGTITREQAAAVWYEKYLLEVETAARTGYVAVDPNCRNCTVVRLKNGQLTGMSFDLEAKGSKVTSLTPATFEKMAWDNKRHTLTLGIELDTTIPEWLRVKYPVLSQFVEAQTGFSLFGIPIGGKNVNLHGYMPSAGLNKNDVQAVAGRVRQMIKSGEINMNVESLTLKNVKTKLGTVESVTLIRSDIAAQNAFRNSLLKGLFVDSSYMIAAFTLVDWIDTGGFRGIEVYAVPSKYYPGQLMLTTGANSNSLDDLVNNANKHRERWYWYEYTTVEQWTNLDEEKLAFTTVSDKEFLQMLYWETGYESITEFHAAMDAVGIPVDIWKPALASSMWNTTYPFQIYGSVSNGRMPLNLRVSSFVNDMGENELIFWGTPTDKEEDGALTPIAVYRKTGATWANDGILTDTIDMSLSRGSLDWFAKSLCTPYGPADNYLMSCVDMTGQ